MRRIAVAYSPDADDAFMFYALAKGRVAIDGPEPCTYQETHADIQTLNRRARDGVADMTQISAAAYPDVADTYRITGCGASMGRDYGPIVVARAPLEPEALAGAQVAIPGEQTTAFLLARMFLPAFEAVPTPFDAVMQAVVDGRVEAGIVIHEGQLTFADHALVKLVDLGEEWFRATRLPLPLGINVVRRALGAEWQAAMARALRDSIDYALAHETDALAYAQTFARGVDRDRTSAFTRMYVNELTLDMGDEGAEALIELYRRARSAGLLAVEPPVDVLPVGAHRER